MIEALDQASAALVWVLATSAARSFVLAGIAAAGLAAFRSRTTSVRLFTWTSVLYAILALPLLGELLPSLEVRLPEFVQLRMASIRIRSAERPQRVTTVAADSTNSRELAAWIQSVVVTTVRSWIR